MRAFLLAVFAICATGTDACARSVFVSPAGDDGADGSAAHPFRTAQRAQLAVRALKGDARKDAEVVFEDGVYPIGAAISLVKEDSGIAGHPVVWRARNRGKAVFTGAASVEPVAADWTKPPASLIPEKSRASVRCWRIPGEGTIPGFRRQGCGLKPKLDELSLSVFSGGKRVLPARWPNDDWARTGDLIDAAGRVHTNDYSKVRAGYTNGAFRAEGAALDAWAKEPDLWANGLWFYEWSRTTTPVTRIDAANGWIAVDNLQNPYGYKKGAYYRVLNAFSELDEPGEWAVDRAARRIYVWGNDAEPPQVCLTESCVVAKGVSDFVLDGFVFEHFRGTVLRLSGAVRTSLLSSCVRRTGGDGFISTDGRDVRVVGCEFFGLGGLGVKLHGGDPDRLIRSGNLAENNHIHHFGEVMPVYNPGISLNGCGNRAVHNHIHDTPHQAIAFSGSENLIGTNLVEDTCLFTKDAGAIYACERNWTHRGNVIERNAVKRTGRNLTDLLMGIYLDDWTSGDVVRGNYVSDVPIAVYLGGGNGNEVCGNVVVNSKDGILVGSRGVETWAKATSSNGVRSVIYKDYLARRKFWDTPEHRAKYPVTEKLLALDPVRAHDANWNVVTGNVSIASGKATIRNWKNVGATCVLTNNADLAAPCDRLDIPCLREAGRYPSPLRFDTDLNPSARFIQRTMHKLAASTKERPADVKILFYGQSTVEGNWYTIIVDDLRRRFPTARIDARNTAIGGFEAPNLVKMLKSDVHSFYPDLIFIQDWGDYASLSALFRGIRANTTAEIVMWTDHVRAKQTLEDALKEEDAFSQLQRRIADENDCMMIHLKRKWAKHHLDNGYPNTKYLSPDGVHMTAEADGLYTDMLKEELVVLDGPATTPAAGTIRTFPFKSSAKRLPDGSLEFEFSGNRVEAVACPKVPTYRYASSPVKVLLDGKEMSGMKDLYGTTRPSGLACWMPVVLRVGFDAVPLEEEWTLTFIEGTDRGGKPVRYRVDGSVTGFDGEGVSTEDFVSKSGRVRIATKDFNAWQFDYFYTQRKMESRAALPGQWINWKVTRNFTDRIGTYLGPGERLVLVSGCPNGRHRLTFVPAVPSKPPAFDELVVHSPAGTPEDAADGAVEGLKKVSAEYDRGKNQ